MKGPNERLKYDLRRVWECPVCKRRERTAGTVTYRHCNCRMKQVDGQPVVMKLVEDGISRVKSAVAMKPQEPATLAEPNMPTINASLPPEGKSEHG